MEAAGWRISCEQEAQDETLAMTRRRPAAPPLSLWVYQMFPPVLSPKTLFVRAACLRPLELVGFLCCMLDSWGGAGREETGRGRQRDPDIE